jgi:hypothetical protein
MCNYFGFMMILAGYATMLIICCNPNIILETCPGSPCKHESDSVPFTIYDTLLDVDDISLLFPMVRGGEG